MCLGVVHPDMVSVAGVAPILVHVSRTGETWEVSGVGPYPRASSPEYFRSRHGNQIPPGLARTVVPAAPAAWSEALARWGTMSFAEVAAPSIEHAERGFPVSPFSAYQMAANADKYKRWPTSSALYLRDGRAYRVGERLVQAELAETLRRMVRAEARAGGSREAGIAAAVYEFYRGETAKRIAEFHRQEGGPLTYEDLADYRAETAAALRTRFGTHEVATCGFWCQGPVLLQMLNLLDGVDLAGLGHNSAGYLHRLLETIKVAFADRDAFYGDPKFVKIPSDRLLSKAYAQARRALIGSHAWRELPPAGDEALVSIREGRVPALAGGSQGWLDPAHAAVVAPGNRPRLTPAPAIAFRDGKLLMPFGTPGGDVQQQAMLQVFLNATTFGMPLQQAIEAPRVASRSFPDSFWPHVYAPGKAEVEGRIVHDVREALTRMGHEVVSWPDWEWRAGAVCAVMVGPEGTRWAGADPRRGAHAIGR